VLTPAKQDYQTNYENGDSKADAGEVEMKAEGLQSAVDQGVVDFLMIGELSGNLAADSEVW
jgi:hypothetical protein